VQARCRRRRVGCLRASGPQRPRGVAGMGPGRAEGLCGGHVGLTGHRGGIGDSSAAPAASEGLRPHDVTCLVGDRRTATSCPAGIAERRRAAGHGGSKRDTGPRTPTHGASQVLTATGVEHIGCVCARYGRSGSRATNSAPSTPTRSMYCSPSASRQSEDEPWSVEGLARWRRDPHDDELPGVLEDRRWRRG
jgi:hypothetical protein